MLSFLVGVVFGVIIWVLSDFLMDNSIWPLIFAILAFMVCTILLNLWIKRRLQKIVGQVHAMIQQNQAMIQRKMNQLQNRGMASAKGLQKQLEKQQEGAIVEALKELKAADYLSRWNFLVKKQLDTMRGQLSYQIKDFAKADQYLENSLNFDPMTVAMKMVRHYKKDDMEAVERLYKKNRKKFKQDNGAIIYGLYSWILVQEDRIDDAIAILNEGKDKTENQVLEINLGHLVNGRVRQFSNAGFGDVWYALHLEKPKTARVKQRRGKRR